MKTKQMTDMTTASLYQRPVERPSPRNEPADLGQRAASALKWNYAGALVRAACQFVTGIVLARLLGPHPYGIVAVAWLVIGVGTLFADLGMSAALVQRKSVSESQIRHVFTLQLGAGLALTAAAAALAQPLAAFYGEPDLRGVMFWLGPLFLIQSGGQTATALLKRELRFRAVQTSQIVSYLTGYCGAGIPLALLGFGVRSLVASQLIQALLYSILVFRAAPHSVRLLVLRRDSAFGFGVQVIGTNIVNWLIGNLDGALVGRRFGTTGLGIYNRAQVLITYQAANIVSVLQNVLFSAYSRAQDSREASRDAYVASLAAVSLILAPVFLTIAAAPRTTLDALYGHRWLSASSLCVPLALAAPFNLAMSLAGPLLWANARVLAELRAQLAACVAAIGLFLLAAGISARAVAWACFAAAALRCGLLTSAVMAVLRLPARRLARNLSGAAMSCLLAWGAAFAADRLLEASHLPPLLRLALVAMAAVAPVAASVMSWPKAILGPCLASAAGRNLALLPKPLYAALRRLEA